MLSLAYTSAFTGWYILPRDARRARATLLSHVVRSSVCLTLVICDHIGCVNSKAIRRIISLVSSLLGVPIAAIQSKGNTPKFGWNRMGSLRVISRKPATSIYDTGQYRAKVTIDDYSRKLHTRAFDWYRNQRPWMTLNGHYVLCSKIHAISEAITKIWMKIDVYYWRRRCSPMTLVSGNIRFMRIFAGVPWRTGIKRQCGTRKRWFSVLLDGMASER